MPGLIDLPISAGLFPVSLSSKFTESHAVQVLVNEYHDGTTQRTSLVTESRRTWKLTKRLTPNEQVTLKGFWEAHRNTAFSFFNPFETNPPFARIPTGTSGLYLVRFASDWDQSIGMARSDAQLELIELSPVRAQQLMTAATLHVVWSYDPGSDAPGIVLQHRTEIEFFVSNSAWSKRTDSFPVTIPTYGFLNGWDFNVHFVVIGVGFATVPWLLSVFDVSADVTYVDGSTATLTPGVLALPANDPTYGVVTHPGFSVDASTTTAATLTGQSLFPTRSNGGLLFTF